MPRIAMDILRRLDRLCRAALPAALHGRLRVQALRIFLPPADTSHLTKCQGYEVQERAVHFRARGVSEIISFDRHGVLETPAALFDPVKCDVVLCCAFTGRHRVLRQVIQESFAANARVNWMLVGSTREDEQFIAALATSTGRVAGAALKNRPLGRKWQSCISLARAHYDAELFGITGSDDILSSRLLNSIFERMRSNKEKAAEIGATFSPSVYATLEWVVVVTDSSHAAFPQIFKCNYRYEDAFQPLGAGRFYTAAFLREVEGRIFESSLDRLLDDRGYFLVRDHGKLVDYHTIEDGPVISVKGAWSQLNSVDDLISAPQLNVREYSFEGHHRLQESLSPAVLKFLFKPGRIATQLSFSSVPSGADYEN
jgi:hypothetical protein